MRDGLVERVRRTEIRLQCLALDVLNHAPSDIRVGANRDREIPVRHDLQQQNVPAPPRTATTAYIPAHESSHQHCPRVSLDELDGHE